LRTLAKSLSNAGTVGQPIPLPWPTLNRDLKMHTKELVLVAGAPGAGKSVVALNVAVTQDTPVIYFAQDSPLSVKTRWAALTLGVEINWVTDQLRNEDKKPAILAELAESTSPNMFVHEGAITVERIGQWLEALTEILGIAPPLVIIDNLIDLIVPGYSYTDMQFYSHALSELKQMSIKYDVCMMALHHVTRRGGEQNNPHGLGTRALKMTDLLYSGEREAEHVLGVWHSVNKDKLSVQILKQRDGDADPEGGLMTDLLWHPRLGSLGRA